MAAWSYVASPASSGTERDMKTRVESRRAGRGRCRTIGYDPTGHQTHGEA